MTPPPSVGPWIRRHRFAAFYGLAVLIVVGVVALRQAIHASELLPNLFSFLNERKLYPNTISIALFGLEDWRAFLIFVFAGAPTISAFTVSYLADGRAGVGRLLSRFRPWRGDVQARSGLRVYLVLAAIYAAGTLGFLLATAGLAPAGSIAKVLDEMSGSWPLAALWLVVGPFLDEGGTWEELGWRGYAQPLLLERGRSPLGATLLLGALWWAWHFPREISNLLAGPDLWTWAFWQGVFLLTCLALSVLISVAWFKTGGSAWPAILIHGLTNVWSKALAAPLNELWSTDLRSWIVVGAAVVALLATRGRLGAGTRTSERSGRAWAAD